MFVLLGDAASLGIPSACSGNQPLGEDTMSWPLGSPSLSPWAGTEAAATPSADLVDCFSSVLSSSLPWLQKNN